MIETATEFTIKERFFGNCRRDVFVPGSSKPVTRMEMPVVDRRRRSDINFMRVKVGQDFKTTIGFIAAGETYDSDHQQIGVSSVDPDLTDWPEKWGVFEQLNLGTLTREVSPQKVGLLIRILRKTPGFRELMRDCAQVSIHYSSPESAGFTINIPRGVTSRCDVTVHDDRINRIQLLATYLYERRQGAVLDFALAPFKLLIAPLKLIGRILLWLLGSFLDSN
ncbi:MAG: hypothetical protein J2P18_01110 [Nocardia sp.]|nr:hypothetical protein [Nocardia sp.]